MKKSLHERIYAFFINVGRRGKLLKGPAIVGLAVSMLIYRFYLYLRGGMKRFACVAFVLLCFMVGNSFAYPVFREENGFVSGQTVPAEAAAEDSDIVLAVSQSVAYDELEILDDEDVLEGYDDAELHGIDTADKYLLEEILNENEISGQDDEEPQESVNAEGETDVVFSQDDWKLVLINKQHPIPDSYTFALGAIKTIKGQMQCDERIIKELLSMMEAASKDGVNLAICSPYRDLNYQKVLFNRKIKLYMNSGMSYMEAYKITSQTVTVPGASEHQIGLAIDIVADNYQDLDEGFAETKAGIWLAEHCQEYGFILRYPQGKENITSIEFEPWHFRYVGKEAATIIMDEEITLEEFWDKYM